MKINNKTIIYLSESNIREAIANYVRMLVSLKDDESRRMEYGIGHLDLPSREAISDSIKFNISEEEKITCNISFLTNEKELK